MTNGFSDIFIPGVVGISLASRTEYLYKTDLYASTKFLLEKNVIIQFSSLKLTKPAQTPCVCKITDTVWLSKIAV